MGKREEKEWKVVSLTETDFYIGEQLLSVMPRWPTLPKAVL